MSLKDDATELLLPQSQFRHLTVSERWLLRLISENHATWVAVMAGSAYVVGDTTSSHLRFSRAWHVPRGQLNCIPVSDQARRQPWAVDWTVDSRWFRIWQPPAESL